MKNRKRVERQRVVHVCGTAAHLWRARFPRFRNREATRGRPLVKHDMWDKNPVMETGSGGAALAGMRLGGGPRGKADREGSPDSWKALGCWTGTCHTQLLPRLID